MSALGRMLALALLVLVAAAPGPAGAETYDFASAKASIATLTQVPGSVRQVIGVVRASDFGPFHLTGSCGYQCLGKLCFRDWRWNWSPDYSWMKTDLESRYREVERTGNGFDGRFSPLRAWLTTTLPQFSDDFAHRAQQLEHDQSRLEAPDTPAVLKLLLARRIEHEIGALTDELRRDSGQVRGAASGLSAYDAELAQRLDGAASFDGVLTGMIARNRARLDHDVAAQGWPCGSDTIRGQYASVAAVVGAQYGNVVATARNFGLSAQRTDRAAAVLLGTVLNVQTQYEGVLEKLRAAQLTPSGAIQRIRLRVAAAAWRDLAAYAKQQFH